MPRSEAERAAWCKQAYGCSEAELERGIADWPTTKTMLAGSILSDAQELLAMGRTEEVRQYLNRAKHIIFEHLEDKT